MSKSIILESNYTCPN